MPTNIKKTFNKFFQITVVLAIVLLVVDFTLRSLAPEIPYSPARPWIILFFLLVTNLIFHYQLQATRAKGSKFVNIFLITTGFKLLFFLAIIVIYALLVRNDAVRFITDFFIIYLLFTAVEVYQIIKNQQAAR